MNASKKEDEIMLEQELADLLRMDIKTISRARLAGKLRFPYVAIGTSVRYLRSAILAEFAKWPSDTDTTAPDEESAPARRAGRPRKNR